MDHKRDYDLLVTATSADRRANDGCQLLGRAIEWRSVAALHKCFLNAKEWLDGSEFFPKFWKDASFPGSAFFFPFSCRLSHSSFPLWAYFCWSLRTTLVLLFLVSPSHSYSSMLELLLCSVCFSLICSAQALFVGGVCISASTLGLCLPVRSHLFPNTSGCRCSLPSDSIFVRVWISLTRLFWFDFHPSAFEWWDSCSLCLLWLPPSLPVRAAALRGWGTWRQPVRE